MTYLVRDRVKLAVQLTHGDGLGVDGLVLDGLELPVALLVEERHALTQGVQHLSFPPVRLADHHEADRGDHAVQVTVVMSSFVTLGFFFFRATVSDF